jgi:hypothetical protein
MTIAPVIPPKSRAGIASRNGRGAARPMPLATPPEPPFAQHEVVYGVGRIDASGRVADRTVIEVLGWRSDDRLTLTAEAGVVVARRDPRGMVTVPARPYITIPAVLRRRCGLRDGDRVLLAAIPGQDTLAVYSFAMVDHAIRTTYGAIPHAHEGPS